MKKNKLGLVPLLATVLYSTSIFAQPLLPEYVAHHEAFHFEKPEVMPHYNYTAMVEAALTIDQENKVAEVFGYLGGYPDLVNSIYMYLYLEKYVDGEWEYVEMFTDSFSDFIGSFEEHFPVESDNWYRVRGSFYAYSGTEFERIERFSSEEYCR